MRGESDGIVEDNRRDEGGWSRWGGEGRGESGGDGRQEESGLYKPGRGLEGRGGEGSVILSDNSLNALKAMFKLII